MARLFSNRERPFDLGVLPTERLARAAAAPLLVARQPRDAAATRPVSVARALPEYLELCAKYLDGPVAPARAPVPDDSPVRAKNLKASAYFLDATLAGVCELAAEDRLGPAQQATGHTHAFVFLVEFAREPRVDEACGEPGAEWILGTNAARTDLRCAEVAVVIAGYLRALGYAARGHIAGHTEVDLERLAQKAGIAKALAAAGDGDGAAAAAAAATLLMPFTSRGFRLGVVSTDYAMAVDRPIAPDASLDWPDAETYLGEPGTRPGFEEAELARRPLHLGRYPMERIRRVVEPTTLVLREEIRRLPKRADLFTRALAGDLGERPQRRRRAQPRQALVVRPRDRRWR